MHRLKLRLSQASFLECILDAVHSGLALLHDLYGDIRCTGSDHRLSFTFPHARLLSSSTSAQTFYPSRASLPLSFNMAAARHAGALSPGPHPRPFLKGAVCGCPLPVSTWTTALCR